jgi:hypothetical protein
MLAREEIIEFARRAAGGETEHRGGLFEDLTRNQSGSDFAGFFGGG